MTRKLLSAGLLLILFLAACTGQATPNLPPTEAPATATPGPTSTPQIPERQPDWTLVLSEGDFWAPLTSANGILYAGGDDGYLYAVDTAAKSIKWKFQTSGYLRSQPTAGDELVYITSDDGYVYAVSIADGSLAWKKQVAETPVKRKVDYNDAEFYSPAPLLQGARLYVGSSNGTFFAMNALTGEVAWTFKTVDNIKAALSPQVDDGLVIFADRFGVVYGLDAETGTQAWINKTGTSIQAGGFLLQDHILYFSSLTQRFAIDAQSGKETWTAPCFYFTMTPAYRDGVLYLDNGTDTALTGVAAYDAASGKFQRSVLKNLNNHAASPVFGKTLLYIGFLTDAFYAIEPESSEVQWKIPVKAGIVTVGVASTAVVADGMVYFAGMDGVLYVVKDE